MAIVSENHDGTGVLVNVKAVPGAKRDEIAGVLGERLKVRVAAPPEGGKANKAICELMARTLGVKAGAVSVVRGQTSPEKTVQIEGVRVDEALQLFKLPAR